MCMTKGSDSSATRSAPGRVGAPLRTARRFVRSNARMADHTCKCVTQTAGGQISLRAVQCGKASWGHSKRAAPKPFDMVLETMSLRAMLQALGCCCIRQPLGRVSYRKLISSAPAPWT